MKLQDRAMLASLNISAWAGRKKDKRVTEETCTRESAQRGAVNVTKNLLVGVDSHLKAIAQFDAAARVRHAELTLPWSDRGARILTTAGFEKYASIMRGFKADREPLVRELLNVYPQAKAAARSNLGNLYRDDDYPSIADLERRFAFSFSIMPLPSGEDFRASLSDGDVSAIRAEIEETVKQAEAEAMRDVWRRLHEVISHMATTLPAYSNGDVKRFNDSLVSNVVELCDLLPALNLSGDVRLDSIAAEAKAKLARHDAHMLRVSEGARTAVAGEASALLEKMRAMYGE